MIYLLGILFFLSILSLFYFIMTLLSKHRHRPIDRISSYLNAGVEKIKQNNDMKGERLNLNEQISKLIILSGKGINSITILNRIKEDSQRELTRAGIPLKGEEFLAIQIFLFFLVVAISVKLTKILILSLFTGIVFVFIIKLLVKIKKAKRVKLFNDQLGDTIVLISNSLKVGHSFLQAIDSAAKEMPDPIAKELGKALNEMRLGIAVEKALSNMLERVESNDLELMISAVSIQRQTGGNLSEILDTIARTIRERIKIKGEIKTLTAQGRMSGLIITFLPIILGILFYFINPDSMKLLFTTKIGLIMLGAAVVNEVIGYLIINKIVNIKV